jgi:hypothetical protein
MVPLPPVIEQFCPLGRVCTVTAYAAPSATGFANTNAEAPFETTMVSLPFASTKPVPVSPLIEPPSVWVAATQVTATLVTAAVAIPDPADTEHTSPLGWVCTVTE